MLTAAGQNPWISFKITDKHSIFKELIHSALKDYQKNVSSNLKIKMILSFGIYPRKEISTTVIKSWCDKK